MIYLAILLFILVPLLNKSFMKAGNFVCFVTTTSPQPGAVTNTWWAFLNISQEKPLASLALCEVLYVRGVFERSWRVHEADVICRNYNVCPWAHSNVLESSSGQGRLDVSQKVSQGSAPHSGKFTLDHGVWSLALLAQKHFSDCQRIHLQ